MAIDWRLVWRVTLYGAAARAVISMVQRSVLPLSVDKLISLPISVLVALAAGAYFGYQHGEQDALPSAVGGALAGLGAIVLGFFVAFRFSFRWLGPIGDGPLVLPLAFIAGAVGALVASRRAMSRSF